MEKCIFRSGQMHSGHGKVNILKEKSWENDVSVELHSKQRVKHYY